MSDPAGRNRLGEEESPYLRQHADNPVNWQPWDEAALDAARDRDVPIFLSVGYSACHWCHVMADESFDDEEVAAALNDRFVPVKVDREERPDLDSVYQTICQLVTGRGGWPLSVWLTPEGKPFYVGTYFPREGKQGMPGFLDLLDGLAHSWEADREEIENRAEQWTRALADQLEETPDAPGDAPDAEVLGTAAEAALRSADREYGGFGRGGPKFPQPGRIELLLRAHRRTGREEAVAVATKTLDAMADGGLYDHVGGGFHRYATDREWTVPHFEKMLYDNAALPAVYLSGYQATGRSRYALVAQETFAFVERELTHPDGGFYSTLDAQSEVPPDRAAERSRAGEEGAFYVWTPEEVRDVLDDSDADLFCDRYGVASGGNFEGGTTVLTVSTSVADLSTEYGMDEATVRERLADARAAAFDARERRPRPARDEKVLAGWNGLMISSFAAGARVLAPELAGNAAAALDFVRERLWDEDAGRLSRRVMNGEVKGAGYLEDYAFLGRGAFDLYQATGEVDHLAFALDLARAIESEFWDESAGTLYFTPASGERLVTRPQELHDQSTPSSVGVAVGLLFDLAHFAPDADFEAIGERVLRTHGDRIRASPLEHVSLALAADAHARGALELTVAADEMPAEWREVLAGRYLPGAIVARRPPTEAGLDGWLDELGLDDAPPIWVGREATDDEPTVYACEAFTCSPPQTDVRAALDWADEN
ncbi:thioredoxin domain-containing protein [Halegenticoccus tardaugens]|uniref:thioredoxin domain-containing protein n=1 Tax=Halegenticoccus tardaugens TaxID=2071624 RepID=UPI00100B0F52|nr:thioredoxin domain-containing protein [Halegenticoccus tardaugens]